MRLKSKYFRRGILIFLGIILFKLVYTLIQNLKTDGVSIATTIDFAIPFIPLFVLFYLMWYPVLLTSLFLSIKKKELFKKTTLSFVIVAGFSFCVYVLFQTEITRAVITSADIFSRIVLFIYHQDMPINCFPSLHVSGSVLANLCTLNANKKIGLIMIPITILIILSTLFIKQHFVFDVIGGIVLAIGTYLLVFKLDYKKLKKQILNIKFIPLRV